MTLRKRKSFGPPTMEPVASEWHRLSTRNRGLHIVGPETGKKLIGLPDGWPQPALPLWRRLEYRQKLPLPSWHEWKLTTGKTGMGFIPKWQGAEFDSWDPHAHQSDLTYRSLNDRSLWRFCDNKHRKKILLSHGLITEKGHVVVSLKEYNQWRRDMFRQQLQLRNKKRAMAERNELCGMIKGFIDAIYDPPSNEVQDAGTASAAVASPDEPSLPTDQLPAVADGAAPLASPDQTTERPTIKRRSGVSDILKLGPINQYEITDEMANSRFDSKAETDAILVELIRLHGFTHQIRQEMNTFNHITIKSELAIRTKHHRDKLIAKIEGKNVAAEKRMHLLKEDPSVKARNRQVNFKRRFTYQNAMEKLDKTMLTKNKINSGMRVDAWKNYFCKKHRQNEPNVPSGRRFNPRYRSGLILEEEKRLGGVLSKQKATPRKGGTGGNPHKDLHAHEKNPVHIRIHGHPHPEVSGHNDSHWHGHTKHGLIPDVDQSRDHPHKDVHFHEKDPEHFCIHGHPHPEVSGHNDSHWQGYAGRAAPAGPATVSSYLDLAFSRDSLSDKPSTLGHSYRHRDSQDVKAQASAEIGRNNHHRLHPGKYVSAVSTVSTVSSHVDMTSSTDSLAEKPSAVGHSHQHHHRPDSPDSQLDESDSIQALEFVDEIHDTVSRMKFSPSSTTSDVGGSPHEVASQSSFEYGPEEKGQGRERSESGRKVLRPLKSALSRPGGRTESQHLKITFAPEVADVPAVPTAKRSSEVLLINALSAKEVSVHHTVTSRNENVDQRDSIPVDVPLRAAESMTSMPLIAGSTTSDMREKDAPEWHPHYITSDDNHRRRPHSPDDQPRPRKNKPQLDQTANDSRHQSTERKTAKSSRDRTTHVAKSNKLHREKFHAPSLDEKAIEAAATEMFSGEYAPAWAETSKDENYHISAGAHHYKHHSPLGKLGHELGETATTQGSRPKEERTTDFVPEQQQPPAIAVAHLQAVKSNENDVSHSEMTLEADKILGVAGGQPARSSFQHDQQHALEVVDEVHKAASNIHFASPSSSEMASPTPPSSPGGGTESTEPHEQEWEVVEQVDDSARQQGLNSDLPEVTSPTPPTSPALGVESPEPHEQARKIVDDVHETASNIHFNSDSPEAETPESKQ